MAVKNIEHWLLKSHILYQLSEDIPLVRTGIVIFLLIAPSASTFETKITEVTRSYAPDSNR